MMTLIGAIIPRFLLLVGWANDPAYWGSALGSPVWLLGGFLFFPMATFTYGYVQWNGMGLLNWAFVAFALLADLGTWGIGSLAARKEVSNFRGN